MAVPQFPHSWHQGAGSMHWGCVGALPHLQPQASRSPLQLFNLSEKRHDIARLNPKVSRGCSARGG